MEKTVDKWTVRVLAMLAKAESTDSPEEADTFFAKAQDLIAQHGIEEAELAKVGRLADGTAMEREEIEIPGSYKIAKGSILWAIGKNNGVLITRTTGKGLKFMMVGRESDLALVRAMFGSILTTAERHLASEHIPSWESTRSFRHSFFLGFASRLNARLAQSNAQATGGSTTGALVVANRISEAEAFLRDKGYSLQKTSGSSSSRAGGKAGMSAADRASLNSAVGSGGRMAIGS